MGEMTSPFRPNSELRFFAAFFAPLALVEAEVARFFAAFFAPLALVEAEVARFFAAFFAPPTFRDTVVCFFPAFLAGFLTFLVALANAFRAGSRALPERLRRIRVAYSCGSPPETLTRSPR